MERLTYDFAIGDRHCWEVHGADNLVCEDVCKNQGDKGCEGCPIREAIDRLAAYEDTGLTPEEIITLKSIKSWADAVEHEFEKHTQAEKDGRLVVLPCRLGGTVYANFALRGDYLREKDKPYPCEVVFIGLSKEPFLHIQFKNGRVFPVNFSEVGKSVFLTREEAEAALKEQEG